MSDPLSITASAAGLVSLGLTVCSGLLDYYEAWRDQYSDVCTMCESLEALGRTFELLDQKVRHPLLDRMSVDRVTESIISCAAGVQGLRYKLDKIQSAKMGMHARLQRAQYPFQQKTLEKLLRAISDLRSNLGLATSTLQLDISIKSLHQINQVDTGMKKLISNWEVSTTMILDSVSTVRLGQEQERSRALSSEERDMINSLCSLEFFSKQNDALSRRQEGTGRWLLESREFRSWVRGDDGRVLWCPGIPGAGKTILASTVIDHLEQEYRCEKIGVAYIYCTHNNLDQTAANLLGSLLQQLTIRSAAVLEDINSCYKHHARCGTRPSLNETARLLRSQVEKFDKVFIVIDALDEYPELEKTQKSFLAEIRGLLPKVRLMVTSRNIPSIENMFKHDTRLEIRAQEQDVRKFIKSQMEQRDDLVDLLEGHDDVRSRITSRVLEKTNGMFLIATLHMDSLAKEDNIRELEESLQRLPGDLDRTYDDALERIKNQDSRKRARADQVLTLVNCAKRPLVLEEMREALSIRKDDTFLDPRALPKTESLISTCCGLVVVEDESQIVRLVHYTTEEYFRRKLQHYGSPEAHRYFAGTLITYLSFTAFATFSQDKMMENLVNEPAKNNRFSVTRRDSCDDETAVNDYMKKLFEDNKLVQYAAENWGHHVRDAFANLEHNPESCIATTGSHNTKMNNSWNLEHLVLDLMGKKSNIACANEVSHYLERKLDLWNYQIFSPREVTDLHIAASFGMKFFVDCFLNQGADISARDSEGMTALHKAAKNGHVEVVRLLLDSGASLATRDREGRSALVWAVSANKVSVTRLLLERDSDSRFESVDFPGLSILSIAAIAGHEEILELLAEREKDDLKRNQLMEDALLDAAVNERERTVRLLTGGGKNWAISKRYPAQAMINAASEGHIKIMKILLEAGVDINSPQIPGSQSLARAGGQFYSQGTQQLLEDVGDWPLHAAVRNNHVHAIALLLENGADVNAQNAEGETAMVVLAKRSHLFGGESSTSRLKDSVSIMQQLLDKGANTAVTDCHFNRTSLEWAVLQGHKSQVRLLLDRETISATRKELMVYLTELYDAIWKENAEAVGRFFFDEELQDMESISQLLLVHIPARRGYDDVVLKFLRSGADIDAKTPYGESALHLAAEEGHLPILEMLLLHGADINSRTFSGGSPLMYAARGGKIAVVELLLDHGARIDGPLANFDTGTTAITTALYGGHTGIAKVLLKRGADANVRLAEAFGGTILHIVTKNQPGGSQTQNINLLLEHGADLEAKDDHGQTPLATAVEDYTFEAIPILLKRGANLEARDNKGRTPLGVAVRNGLFEVARILIEAGANLEAKDKDGHTPLVMAVRLGYVRRVNFLLERGADSHALPPAVTVEDEDVYEYDFDRAIKIVLEAQSKIKS